MNTLRGNQLVPADRQYVLAAYVYRQTVENQRQHPGAVAQAGGTLPLITDERWLAVTSFNVTKTGRIDQRVKQCFTHNHEIPEHKVILDTWAQGKAA